MDDRSAACSVERWAVEMASLLADSWVGRLAFPQAAYLAVQRVDQKADQLVEHWAASWDQRKAATTVACSAAPLGER